LNQVKSDIYKKNKDVFRSLEVEPKAEQRLKLKVANILRDRVEQEIGSKVDVLPPESLKAFQEANKNYGALAEASEILEESLTQDKGKNFITKAMNDGIQRYLGVSTVLASQASAPAAVAGATVMGLRSLSQQPWANKVLAKSANSVASAISKNPDKYNAIASRLASSAAISSEKFFDTFVASTAQVDLMEQPLARNTEEVIRRQDSIVTLASSLNKDLGDRLRKAIQNKNVGAIRQAMSLASSMAPDMVQPGIGWDGMAITPQDNQAVQAYLQSVKSPRDRMMMSSKFAKDGMIPDSMFAKEEPMKMQQFVYTKRRNKVDKPEY